MTECGAGATIGGGVTSAPADIAVSITMLYMSCNLYIRNNGTDGEGFPVFTMVELQQKYVKGKRRKLG